MDCIEAPGSPGPKDRAAMKAQVKNKISRIYDKPLASILTALAFMTLSIIISLSLT